MALVSLPSPIAWPGCVQNASTAPAFGTAATLDAAGEYMSYVFAAREDMVISHVGFRAGTVAGSPTATVTIETVDPATGLPNGAGFSSSSGTTGTLSTGTNVLQALGAPATITKGQIFCAKVAYATGTSFIVQNLTQASLFLNVALPYAVTNVGTPTKSAFSNSTSAFAFGSSSTTFYQVAGAFPASAITRYAFNNTSSAKRGMRFVIPMNCRVVGLRYYSDSGNGNYNVGIYDDGGSELSSSATAYVGLNRAVSAAGATYVYFDNTVTLTAGTAYRVALEPTSATNAVIGTLTLPSANYRGASPGGTNVLYATYTSGTGWVDTATDQVPLMDLLIDQVDDGSGTGGVTGVIGG